MTDLTTLPKLDGKNAELIEGYARAAQATAEELGELEQFKKECTELVERFTIFAQVGRSLGLPNDIILDGFLGAVQMQSGASFEEATMMVSVAVSAVTNNFFIDG